nr:immunoglobulin light chain junction region [Macaca mulatta]
CQQAYSIPLTF